jgi:hypothetical protein
MPTEIDFVKNQDRTYFNIHKPTPQHYNDQYVKINVKANPLEPASEVDRQTGSGYFNTMPYFQPLAQAQFGNGPMKNNFDISVKAPIDKAYTYSQGLQLTMPVLSKINKPLQHGSGSFAPLRSHEQPNPAINNWKPGTRIPEPTRTYEYSAGLQLHDKPRDPILIMPNRGPLIHETLSSDDMKKYSQTQKFYNTFIHVPRNPLIIKG